MRSAFTVSMICLFSLILLSTVSMAEQIYLKADFNDKTIDAPIGMGGAALGEPVMMDDAITAIVREGPLATPNLEIEDVQTANGYVRFEFLGDVEVTTGMVDLSADLWFNSLLDASECTILVKNASQPSQRFAELGIEDDGHIWLHYGQSFDGGTIGQVETGRAFRIIFEFDMDSETFDVWLDGVEAASDLEHEIADTGIGSFMFGCHYDEDAEGSYYVDAIQVTDYFQATPTEEHSWGRVKAGFR